MQDEITIAGKKYKLVPVEEKTSSILDGYKIEENVQETEFRGIKDAVPKVSDYRERFKKRQLKVSDVSVLPTAIEPEDKTGGMLEGYQYKGEGLFFGEGLQRE